MPEYCAHGIVQLKKLGVDVAANGVEVCRGCGKPTRDSAIRAGQIVMPTVPKPTAVLVVTMNDIPGYEIEEVLGDVFGLTVRARNYFSNIGASMRTVTGGEVGGYTKLLIQTRNEARTRLVDEARKLGANAVVAMRFDCNEIGDIMTEVAAYGTAVKAAKRATPSVSTTPD
jgi:uncharacterized protein YbjQ (UPF0145 family)